MAPSEQPAARYCEVNREALLPRSLFLSSVGDDRGCAAKHHRSPKFPLACRAGAPNERSHSVTEVEFPIENNRRRPSLGVVPSPSSSQFCVQARFSMLLSFAPRMIVSWNHRPPSGFQSSISPFARPSARRRSFGLRWFPLAMEGWEKARALIALGG